MASPLGQTPSQHSPSLSLPPPRTPGLQSSQSARRFSTQTNGPLTAKSGDSHDGGSSEEDSKLVGVDGGDEQARKRRRIDGISSCETCKQRKVKCDRSQPSCGWCSRNGQECIYRQKKKPGLRAGIGRELEERLDRVEAMLASHSQLLEAHLQNSASVITTQFPSPSTASHLSPPMSHQGSIAAGTSPQQHQVQPPPNPPTHQQHQPNFAPADATFRERNREMADLSTSRSFDADLPTDDILCTMIDLFFQHIHPTCPILHRQTLLDSFFQRRPSEVEEADIILMHAIVSAALRFSADRRLDETWKEHFRQLTKRKVIFYALEHPSVQSLRAIVIVVLDVTGSTNGPSGWGLLAMTTRMALHLGLAVEPARDVHTQISTMGVGALPESKDWIEEEGRRRLFWMIYALDVTTTLGTSLDLTLDETEIERQLPCRDSLWDRNQQTSTRWFRAPKRSTSEHHMVNNVESLSAFSYQIEAIGILGRIHRFLRETVDINVLSDVEAWQLKYRTLDKALTTWKYSLPMSYGNLTRALNIGGSAVDPAWVMLHAIYNTAVIRLHSSAAYPTTRSSIFGPSYSAGQRCLSAVENIAALTRLVLANNLLPLLGSTFAFTVWVAARLLLVHASTSDSTSKVPDVRIFLDALREGGKTWQTAARYAAIIQHVVDELMHGADGATSERERSCVEILADMRMTAYGPALRMPSQGPLEMMGGGGAGMAMMGGGANGGGGGEGMMPLQGDLMDVFSWFNFPRVAGDAGVNTNTGWTAGEENADWLFQV
ncbi:fungal-specific transcription factor domain-containing protein [Geopyxis carbonaria]|nr:fungal-specific transcription factor domain-containing protein [Geopyxis carbonaria]